MMVLQYLLLIFHNIMSVTPVEHFENERNRASQSESPSDCDKCKSNQIEYESSSQQQSSQGSQSISIHVNAKDMPTTNLRFKKLQTQVSQLRGENQVLMRKNNQLLKRLQEGESQKELKRQIRAMEKQIQLLKNQASLTSYGLSNHSKYNFESAAQSKQQFQFEQKKFRLNQVSGRKDQRGNNQSVESSISKNYQFKESKREKEQWKVQRLLLQKQICKLQESVLLYEEQMKWVFNLANKVISMGQKLGFLFKEKILQNKWSVRRQAKASWRYLKHILQYLLQIQ